MRRQQQHKKQQHRQFVQRVIKSQRAARNRHLPPWSFRRAPPIAPRFPTLVFAAVLIAPSLSRHMERRLQSSLEKKTRVGWQTRVYRLERGYLSGWADVSSVAANEEPSRVICLFQGDQVATLSDQGT